MSTGKHQDDDIRGNLVLRVGEVKEEKTYFKLRMGNNIEDVNILKNSIKEECGQQPEVQSMWCYVGQDVAALPQECKFKAKDAGTWVDIDRIGSDVVTEVKNLFPPADGMGGELFIEAAMTSDKTFKDGFYSSFNFRVSLDGSHEFALNFGKFLMKARRSPLQEKLLLGIVEKFKEFDFTIDFDSYEQLEKEHGLKLGSEQEGTGRSGILDDVINAIRSVATTFIEPNELAGMIAKGMRVAIFLNKNMYVNVELKGEGAEALLESN